MSDEKCDARGKGWACHETVYARGMCKAHYTQRQRGKQALQPVRPRNDDEPLVGVQIYLTVSEVKQLGKNPGLRARELVRMALAELE